MARNSKITNHMGDVLHLVLECQNAALRDPLMPDVQLLTRDYNVPAIQIFPDAHGVGLYGGGKRKAGEGFGDGVKRVRELLAEHQIGGFADGQA